MAAAANSATSSTAMQPITHWQDVSPFAGTLVAFKTGIPLLRDWDSGDAFTLSDKNIFFGYVSEKPKTHEIVKIDLRKNEEGYSIFLVLKPNGYGRWGREVCDTYLGNNPLSMATATKVQQSKILEAITQGRAKLDAHFKDRAIEILSETSMTTPPKRNYCVML